MSEMPQPPDTRKVRAVVGYRRRLLRDVAVRILTDAGIEVIAAVGLPRLLQAIQATRPDVVVLDQSGQETLGAFSDVTLLSRDPASPVRVVTVGLTDKTMVVCSKSLVRDASAESLVRAVAGEPQVLPMRLEPGFEALGPDAEATARQVESLLTQVQPRA